MEVYDGTYTVISGRQLEYPEVFIQGNFDMTEAQRAVVEKAVVAGAAILYGTDGGVLPHDIGGWQFQTMFERGTTPMQAVESATTVAAKHMKLDDEIGAISEGLRADIIAVRGDPFTDIIHYTSPDGFSCSQKWRPNKGN